MQHLIHNNSINNNHQLSINPHWAVLVLLRREKLTHYMDCQKKNGTAKKVKKE